MAATQSQLLNAYAQCAVEHGQFLSEGKWQLSNAVVEKMSTLVEELKALTGGDLTPLKVLLCHEIPVVRRCAAGSLLETNDADAENALESMGQGQGIESFLARNILNEWRARRAE